MQKAQAAQAAGKMVTVAGCRGSGRKIRNRGTREGTTAAARRLIGGAPAPRGSPAVKFCQEMEKRTKTWITIIVSVLAVIVMLGVAAIGGTAYWIYSHVHTQRVAQETAGDSFARARARFSGQQPLIE